MSKTNDGQTRGKYTLKFKLEEFLLVIDGQAVSITRWARGDLFYPRMANALTN